jgi:uncharacterized membrane protein
VAVGLFVAALLAGPWLEARGLGGLAALRWLCEPLCHQIADRCFQWDGVALAVCARCLGLYVGAAAGLCLWPRFLPGAARTRRRLLLVALAPTLVDVLAGRLGLGGLAELPRFLVALPPGVLLGMLLAEGLADLVRLLITHVRRPSDGRLEVPDG